MLVLFCLALVILFGCTQNNPNTDNNFSLGTSTIDDNPKNVIDITRIATGDAVLDECGEKSTTLEELAICVGDVAAKKNDISVCFNNDTGVMNPLCVGQYAFDKNDISICGDSNNAFGTCLFRYAYLANDASYCSFEANAWEYSQTSRSDCFTMLATKKNELYICDQWILDNKAFSMTANSTESNLLQTLNSETDTCYRTIAMLQNDYFVCDKIAPNGNNVFECYMGVAIASSNPSVCDHITNKAFADYCRCSADFSQKTVCTYNG